MILVALVVAATIAEATTTTIVLATKEISDAITIGQ